MIDRWRHRGAAPNNERGWIVYARSTTIQAQSECIDTGIAHVRDVVMPALQGMDGCIGVSLWSTGNPAGASPPVPGRPRKPCMQAGNR